MGDTKPSSLTDGVRKDTLVLTKSVTVFIDDKASLYQLLINVVHYEILIVVVCNEAYLLTILLVSDSQPELLRQPPGIFLALLAERKAQSR